MVGRRHALLASLLVLVPTAVLALAGCGGSGGQLQVALTGDKQATYKPGDLATLKVAVSNTGPGSVNGVTVHVALPPGFRYRSTEPFTASGTTRTQPLDASVNSQSPIWGVWNLGPPGTAGAGITSEVDIVFNVEVQGQPGNDPVGAYAVGDVASGQSNAAPVMVAVAPAAHLDAQVTVTPTTVKTSGSVQYAVRVTNTGTDEALIGVLITLPPSLTFTSSVLPFAGNAARNGGTNPIKNSLEVFYDGFTLPANSSAGPGFVVIQFKATVGATAQVGTFPVDCTITDSKGDTFSLHAVAPLTLIPGPSPTARPVQGTPVPSASSSPSPSAGQ